MHNTGSISYILDEVKGRLHDLIQRLQSDIPGIACDYCDEEVFYLKNTSSLPRMWWICVISWVVSRGPGGGNQDECYELILREVDII